MKGFCHNLLLPCFTLFRNLNIDRPNQVLAADITYMPMARGFMYLVVVMNWQSRKVLSWRLFNTLETDFCVEELEDALLQYGRPEIFPPDRGAQFTSQAFTGLLKSREVQIRLNSVLIGM